MTISRDQVMEKVVALTKRRGFIYPSSEIYGGLSGFYDYGPYGVSLKRAIRDLWWRHMVELRDDVVGLESTLIMPEAVWDASGHLQNFVDPLRQCLGECKRRWRADMVLGEKCPECGGPLDDARMFNLMFKTYVGPLQDRASEVTTPKRIAVALREADDRHRVRVPVRLGRARGHRGSDRLRPGRAPGKVEAGPDVPGPGNERALPAVGDRAGGERGADLHHAAAGRVRRGRGEQRAADPAAPAPKRGPGPGGGGAAIEEAGADRGGAGGGQVATRPVPCGV